ncbi:carboxymethylenebutenolidase [Pleomorphomonas diazotrophica]|uniref:Carboxymethylenebutenolidase n=1 Tax=Pleomorphomonas diazotrophica TaxID=1166257 RepID=A0A1I4VHS2_9HYPH|nr:dienelactone hydrolase family protein [Pleomorphomonas diazotrophica]PKR90130.1 carboxymethylenebutenolidase [Pleomorphomonas diazotrophica]SFN00680.1 carboxymethylenebutenolidase [Pleomorphomonas diazotrophica]
MSERIVITQDMIRLYDEYTHLTLDRRGFMEKLGKLAGSSAAAAAIVPLIEARQAQAAIVEAGDDRLETSTVEFPGDGGTMKGYLVRPKSATGPLPAVMVIHENRGLNGHIEDVARRLALEGFLVLAPDFLSPAGGTPTDEDKAREMIGALDRVKAVGNAVAAATFLRGHEGGNGKSGSIGFCWGGGLSLQTAVADPGLGAAVSYYGAQPAAEQVAAIKAPLLLHYAGLDDRINAGIPVFEAALKEAGKTYELHTYPGVNHAFNNDTSAARYDKAAADLAWKRTVDFLKSHLA